MFTSAGVPMTLFSFRHYLKDTHYLVDSLAGAIDNFGVAGSYLPVMIDPCENQIGIGQSLKCFKCFPYGFVPAFTSFSIFSISFPVMSVVFGVLNHCSCFLNVDGYISEACLFEG
jgi:hypothetical protein